jgi:predicted nucleic acid-binding protein
MAVSALVDTGFLVALLSTRDANHRWAAEQAPRLPPPWMTCEAVLSETAHLFGERGTRSLASLLRRGALICRYRFADDMDAVLKLLEKYADVPHDRDAERSHAADHGHRFSHLPAARPSDHSLRAAALKPGARRMGFAFAQPIQQCFRSIETRSGPVLQSET